MSNNYQPDFPMWQLSVPPAHFQQNLFETAFFSRMETALMAAVLVKLCQRSGVWEGFEIQGLSQHAEANAHPTDEDQGLLLMLQSPLAIKAGLDGLQADGAIIVVCHQGDKPCDVVYPTEVLLHHLDHN